MVLPRLASNSLGNRDTLAHLCRVSAAAVETRLPNGLQRILCPEFLAEDVGRHLDWVFAYQLAFIRLEGRYFRKSRRSI